MDERPNYYAILTADVRYDERLSSTEKLLYAEITALASKDGVCWASNNYFASLYKVTPVHISRMLNKLKECGYIRTELEYKPNSKEIKKRNIYLLTKMLRGINKNVKGGINKNVKENNTSINNINIIKHKNFENNIINGNVYELYEN
jgi:hypothetical protein